jgi:multiple sugar transport system permease protein
MANRKQQQARAGLMMTLPAMIFVASLLVYPCFNLIKMSFIDYSPMQSLEKKFVGLQNYSWAINSENVCSSLKITLGFTALSVGLETVTGLLVALVVGKLLLEGGKRIDRILCSLVNGLLILPFAAPAVSAAIAWKMLLQPAFGPVNALLGTDIAWFSKYPLLSVAIADAWKMMPMVFFLFLSGILSIDPTQFEAAHMDGATGWQEFFYLTLPAIWPIVLVTTAFRAVDAFTKVFDIVMVTTGGGPARATEVFPLLIWKTAFSHLRFGQASALAVIAIMISIILGGSLLLFRRKA